MTLRLAFLLPFVLLLAACTQASSADRQSLRNGFDQYAGRRYDQAETAAAHYLQKYPQDPNVDEAYYLRGMARMGKGDLPAAAQDLHTAITRSQRNDLKAKSYRALGDMAFDAQRWEQAIDYYGRALPFYPPSQREPMVLYRLGSAEQNLGLWVAAKPHFQQAAQLLKDPALRQRAMNRANATAFSLQFAAFASQANAQAEARRLQSLGVRATIVPEFNDRSLIYTIRAGIYRDFASADEARRQLLPRFPAVRVAP